MGRYVNWMHGTLRRYESIASVGAWFCAQNFVQPNAFAEFLLEFLPAVPSHYTLTIENPSFDFIRFARALNEPIEIVRSLGVARLGLGEIERVSGVGSVASTPFRVCEHCLHQRFHSVWHQVPWLERCVFHDMPLRTMATTIKHFRRPPQLSRDVLRVGTLKDLWFSRDDGRTTWRLELGNRRKGLPRNHHRRAEEIASDLETGRRNYADPDRPDLADATSLAATLGQRVVGLIELANVNISWRGLVNVPEDERRREAIIPMAPTLARAILEIPRLVLNELVCDLRRVACHASGERPEWRQVEEKTLAALWRGHHGCSQQVEEFFRGDGPHLHAPYWSESVDEPLIRLASVGAIPCRRLLALDLLEKDTSVCKAFQRIVAPMKKSGCTTTVDWPSVNLLHPESPFRAVATIVPLPPRPPSHIYLSEESVRRLIDWRQAIGPYESIAIHGLGVPVGAAAEVVLMSQEVV